MLFAKISCKGTFSGEMSGTAISLALVPSVDGTGHPQVAPSTTLKIGGFKVSYKFSNTICKIGGDVVKLFINAFKGKKLRQ